MVIMASLFWPRASLWLLVIMAPLAFGFDPMAPPNAKNETVQSGISKKAQPKKIKQQAYVLRQIVSRDTLKSAVINGHVVTEGTYIDGAFIQSIKENSVVLKVKGKRTEIILESKLPRIRR